MVLLRIQGAAAECGLAEVTGQIKAGLAADLAAFAGNPLEDLRSFFKPTFVMARGQRHKLTPIAPFGNQQVKIEAIKKALSLASVDTTESNQSHIDAMPQGNRSQSHAKGVKAN